MGSREASETSTNNNNLSHLQINEKEGGRRDKTVWERVGKLPMCWERKGRQGGEEETGSGKIEVERHLCSSRKE